jgi:hypothetical protein
MISIFRSLCMKGKEILKRDQKSISYISFRQICVGSGKCGEGWDVDRMSLRQPPASIFLIYDNTRKAVIEICHIETETETLEPQNLDLKHATEVT